MQISHDDAALTSIELAGSSISASTWTGRVGLSANHHKTALVSSDLADAYVSQHVGLVRPVFGEIGSFLYSWIISPAHGRGVLEKAAYGAGKPGLNLDHLRELAIALPPLAEQARIGLEMKRHFGAIEETVKATTANICRAGRLRESILKTAFGGKLVPQNPNDEPASALLERIRTKSSASFSLARAPGRNPRRKAAKAIATH